VSENWNRIVCIFHFAFRLLFFRCKWITKLITECSLHGPCSVSSYAECTYPWSWDSLRLQVRVWWVGSSCAEPCRGLWWVTAVTIPTWTNTSPCPSARTQPSCLPPAPIAHTHYPVVAVFIVRWCTPLVIINLFNAWYKESCSQWNKVEVCQKLFGSVVSKIRVVRQSGLNFLANPVS